VRTYGFNGTNSKTSTFGNDINRYNLAAPSLNISTFYEDTYAYSNTTYTQTYLEENGNCQQEPTYQWGFSIHILMITMVLTTVWAIGTYALWLDAYLHSRFDHSQRDMGIYRAVLDLADAMHDAMGNNGQLRNLSNHELKEKIRKDISGGRIGYYDLDERNLLRTRACTIKRMYQGSTDTSGWEKRSKWRDYV
jgi:hypothetical protein